MVIDKGKAFAWINTLSTAAVGRDIHEYSRNFGAP